MNEKNKQTKKEREKNRRVVSGEEQPNIIGSAALAAPFTIS